MKTDLMRKVEKISKFSTSIDKVKALTGYDLGLHDSAQEGAITKDLFMLLALLELYSAAYMEADVYFSR